MTDQPITVDEFLRTVTVPKFGALTQFTTEWLLGQPPLTPERQAEIQQDATVGAYWAAHTLDGADLLIAWTTDPVLKAVLNHHRPVQKDYQWRPVCEGCDLDGMEVEPPEWPCSTWTVVLDAFLQEQTGE